MTYADLAEMLGVTLQTVGRWANGINEPNIETLLRMSEIFNCSLDVLIRKDLSNEMKKLQANGGK